MAEIKRWRFFLPPQTHIRTTQAENWMFAVDEQYLIDYGKKKYDERVAKKRKNLGTPNNYLNRKRAIEKYWDYKRKLKELAEEQKFIMSPNGCWIKFFIKTPKSWTKKKKKEMCFSLHSGWPDADNLFKGFADSIMKEDKIISDFRVSKFFYDGSGHIEVTLGELPIAQGYTSFKIEDKIK